jgi:hypothetical protein
MRGAQMLSSHWCQASGLGLGLASRSQTPPHRPSTSPTDPTTVGKDAQIGPTVCIQPNELIDGRFDQQWPNAHGNQPELQKRTVYRISRPNIFTFNHPSPIRNPQGTTQRDRQRSHTLNCTHLHAICSPKAQKRHSTGIHTDVFRLENLSHAIDWELLRKLLMSPAMLQDVEELVNVELVGACRKRLLRRFTACLGG